MPHLHLCSLPFLNPLFVNVSVDNQVKVNRRCSVAVDDLRVAAGIGDFVTDKQFRRHLSRTVCNSLRNFALQPFGKGVVALAGDNGQHIDMMHIVAQNGCVHAVAVLMPQIKQSSYVKYRNMIQLHLIPCFGNHRITAITRGDVNQFCSELLLGDDDHTALSPKSVTSIISVMKNIFEYADQVKKYDVTNLTGISVKQTQKRLRILSVNEQQRLCEYLFEHFDLCNFGILLSLYTGLRIGEVCALKWEDVLFDERVLYIHQTMQRLQITNSSTSKTEISVSSPKSECSMRKIPIPDKLYDFMVKYRLSLLRFFDVKMLK